MTVKSTKEERDYLDTENIFIRIHRRELVFLNGLLESYDDLAVIKTLDPSKATAVVMVSPGQGGTVRALLDSLPVDVGLEIFMPEEKHLALYREKIYGSR